MIRQLGTTALGVHRATLHRTLREALPASSLHTNALVEHVESGPDRAEVRYRGPTARTPSTPTWWSAPTACAAGSVPSSGHNTRPGVRGIDDVASGHRVSRSDPGRHHLGTGSRVRHGADR
ncbi:hypothetical protein NKG94_10755 [Micromonospora sp. M12]